MSPFDAARYAQLLEGLEVVELRLSEVRKENEKLRLDSGYFAKPMLAADAIARAYVGGFDELGSVFSRFVKGIFDINADSYSDEGVPFLRILNLKNGVIEASSLALIPEVVHQREIKTELRRGDIVLSKTAYPAASIVTVDRCNASQDTIATTLSAYGSETYRAEAIVAFLNSSIGQQLQWRQFQGNVQLHLGLDDGRKIPMPRLAPSLQLRIAEVFQLAQGARVMASTSLEAAETLLARVLGLENWLPTESLSYVRTSGEAFAAERLDAEYFHPAKSTALLSLRSASDLTVGDLFSSVRHLWQPDSGLPTDLVRNYDLNDALAPFLDGSKPPVVRAEIASTKKSIQAGDLVVSRLRSYLREIAVVESSQDYPMVASTEYIVLRPREKCTLPVEALLVYLRSQLPQLVFQWSQDGSNHPRFDEKELLRIPVPRALMNDPTPYVLAMQNLKVARQQATQLLDAAKRAVEIAIEDSEAAALAYLADVVPPEVV